MYQDRRRNQNLEGIKEISSRSFEGLGVVNIEVRTNYNLREVMDDIKTRVASIDTFPVEAERPIIQELSPKQQVINLAIYGDVNELSLKILAEEIRDDLLDYSQISRVDFANSKPYEIAIEVEESILRRHNLSFEELATSLRALSQDIPGGNIDSSPNKILIRTKGQAYTGLDFENFVVARGKEGKLLRLKDIATIKDGLEEIDKTSRFNGQPAAILQVFRMGMESALQISSLAREYVEAKKSGLPAGIEIDTWEDSSVYLRGRMRLLIKTVCLESLSSLLFWLFF